MRATLVLIVSLCGCNVLLGIGDQSPSECEGSACPDAGSVGSGSVGSGSMGSGSPGSAPVCSAGSICVTPYQVKGTTGPGLAVQSEPHSNHIQRWVPNGTTLGVLCQTMRGDQEDQKTYDGTTTPFTTWDLLDDGNWVYDWYMTTPPVVQGYSPGVAHCSGG